jgi:hypothetical protein
MENPHTLSAWEGGQSPHASQFRLFLNQGGGLTIQARAVLVKNLSFSFFLSHAFKTGDKVLNGPTDDLRATLPRPAFRFHQLINPLKRWFVNRHSNSSHSGNDD